METASLPAVIIGGPPHSGKSVLVYSLTRGLRTRRIDHYVLRACPDGEGDFSSESDQVLVRTIRQKGPFTPDFTALVARYLADRHLPLLVDVGGRPTEDQAAIFGLCTHAILLVGYSPDDPARYHADLETWQELLLGVGVPIIAELKSELNGQDALTVDDTIIRGTISGLERGQTVSGPVTNALLDKLEELFHPFQNTVEALHRATAPAKTHFTDLPALATQLGSEDGYWAPEQLEALHDAVPKGETLAVYGRAPNWVYAMLALHTLPAKIYHFDARYGWLTPPTLPIISARLPGAQQGWQPEIVQREDYLILKLFTSSQYLDPAEPDGLPLPELSGQGGLVLWGKVPNWLLLAAGRQLGPERAWLAVYQPQLDGAVVVSTNDENLTIGQVIPVPQM